jgi:hypothetical protein
LAETFYRDENKTVYPTTDITIPGGYITVAPSSNSPCNLTSGNSFGVCAECPTGGMPPVLRSVILLFHENDQIIMEVTKCGKTKIL